MLRMRPLIMALLIPAAISCVPIYCGGRESRATLSVSNAALQTEVARLDASLVRARAAKLPQEFAPAVDAGAKALDKARRATTDEARLYRLRDAAIEVDSLDFLARYQSQVRTVADVQSIAASRAAIPAAATGSTLLERALAQQTRNKAARVGAAAVPFAKVSAPTDGLYYLAEARANERFQQVLQQPQSVDQAAERVPSHDALIAALDSLDDLTLKNFGDAPTEGRMIPVSARLKEARELLDQHLDEAATLALCEARLILSRQTATPAQAKTPALKLPPANDSMQRMLGGLAAESPEYAGFIARDVRPFYDSLYTPVAAKRVEPAAVTVTLLRWPYT